MPPPETPVDPAPEPTHPDAANEPASEGDGIAAPDREPTDVPSGAAGEPSLRDHLVDTWHRVPPLGRWGAAGLLVLLLAWVVVPRLGDVVEGPAEGDAEARAARDRAQWAAMLRQSPTELGTDPVADELGPGDAERADDRYADYYVHQADSVAFSVLVTSDAFAPDLSVRLSDGRTIAASDLLRTDSRAEIDGLMGPGRFEIVVTSRDTRAQGPYELAVVRTQAADSVYADGAARLDSLGAGSRRAGRYERSYGISAGTDLPVVIRVVSTAFAPRVQLIAPNGEVRDGLWSVERTSRGDSLHGVYVRYVPGWESAYRLLVSSEELGATGPFALDVRTIPVRELPPGEGGVRGALGDESWLEDGRYIDTYRFRTPKGRRARISVESDAFPPAFRLWRVDGRSRTEVTDALNPSGAPAAEYEGTLQAGEYFLEVTSGGPKTERPVGGAYTAVVRAEALEPESAPATGKESMRPLATRSFSTDVRQSGESGGDTFEVGVTNVTLSYPAGQRTRVQLSVTVRSLDYTGNWAPWESFARQAYVVDDRGRRYTTAVEESTSPSGPAAEPGTARRGTVVLYLPEVVRDLDRLVFVASIGERTLTLPISVP